MASGPFVADIDMMIDREGAPTSAVEGDHRFSHLRKLLKKVGLEAGSN